MSAAIDLQRKVGDYFNLAQKYFTETVDLVEHQGHSILITSDSAICQDAVEVHGVAP